MKLNLAPLFPETCKEQKTNELIVNMDDVFMFNRKDKFTAHHSLTMNDNKKIEFSDGEAKEAFKEFEDAHVFHKGMQTCAKMGLRCTPEETQQAAYNAFVQKYRMA